MLCVRRSFDSDCKFTSLYLSALSVSRKQDAQLARLASGYWYVYRECMSRLNSGLLSVDSVTQFAKLVRKIDGRELLKGLPSSIVYRACADAGYDKLYGRVERRDMSFALPTNGYVILNNKNLSMLGVDGNIKLCQKINNVPDVRHDASVNWSKKSNQWLFGFWSSTAA